MTVNGALPEDAFDDALGKAEALVAEHDSADARRALGGLYFIDDRFSDAQRQWEVAFRMFRDIGRFTDAARAAIDIAALHISVHAQSAAGAGWIERARILLDRVGPCVEWGYLELAALACDRPDAAELLKSADRALSIALEFGDADLEAQAMADSGLALLSQGRTVEGLNRLDAALAAISAGEVSPKVASTCFCSMLTACDRTGDVKRAQEWTGIVSSMIRGLGDRPKVLHTHCRVAYGSVLRSAGRWTEAEELMIAALGPPEAPTLAHRPLTIAHLAGLRIEQGRIEEAAQLLAPYEDRVDSCGPLAQVHMAQGNPDLAVAVLQRGLRELVADSLRVGPLLSLLVVAELQRGEVAAAAAAADQLRAIAGTAAVPTLLAESALADARLHIGEGDDATAIQELERVVAILGAERPVHVAAVRLELAEALARANRTAEAIAEARAALACFERLEARTRRDQAAALLRNLGDTSRTRTHRPDDVVAALSAREREVLELVRHGLSNAEIASRLFISRKTAEHHVGRVLTKLAVRSRAEAAAVAVRLSLTTDE